MIAASLFDHPGYLLLIAFIALVRWLVSKAKGQAQDTQTPTESPPAQPIKRGGSTQSEEERIRKFLEALGQPAGTTPPPKVTPRRRQAQPRIFPKLPPLTTSPPPFPQTPVMPPPLPVESTPPAPRPTAPVFEVQDIARQRRRETPVELPRRATARFDLRTRIGTPEDLRTAIVLREIFGPPRGLQSFDLTS